MTDKQFKFSLTVGVLMIVLGAIIAGKASVGISLLGLGVAILILSVLTRDSKKRISKLTLAPSSIGQARQNASAK